MIPTDAAAGGSVVAFLAIFGAVAVAWLVAGAVVLVLELVGRGDS